MATAAFAQNDRVNDHNNTNWVQLFLTKKLGAKTDWLIEYQWRRTGGFTNWQQGLFRTAIQYRLSATVSMAAGYAEAETFPYGDYPIAGNGTFPEHRLFEQVVIKQPINKLTFTNRFRIEQRWLGRRRPGDERKMDGWTFVHRFRYQCKLQVPLWTGRGQHVYAAAADELFIGAGKNLGVNIFDQNRIFLLAGYTLNKHITVEAGYFNQLLQQGRRVNNNTIIQRNNGIVLSSYVSF